MPTENGYIGFFDGACEPRNPGGVMGMGALMLKDGQRIWETSWMEPASPRTSNNVAEYLALNAVLDWCFENDLLKERIVLCGDSNLVIQQMFGKWKMRGGFYVEHAIAAKKKILCFASITGMWVPRDENWIADDLSKASLVAAGVQIVERHAAPNDDIALDVLDSMGRNK